MGKYFSSVDKGNMDKYIGNKKAILPYIEQFMHSKGIHKGILIDAFSGTTNVSQYFKQRGFGIICNDANSMSYVLGKAYIENNEFPSFTKILEQIDNIGYTFDYKEINADIEYIKRKIENDLIFPQNYFQYTGFSEGIIPLTKVLQYLNHLSIDSLDKEEELIFQYYCKNGDNSGYISARGSKGKRNYFTEENAKHLGKIVVQLKKWNDAQLFTSNEQYVLLTALIEEVTLIANVNGTFHDFNRTKLYPNAQVPLHLKPIMLNIFKDKKRYEVFVGDANQLYKVVDLTSKEYEQSSLYIDPPYNFRQYGAYYHFLNFLAEIYHIDSFHQYLSNIQYVRGQNMDNNFVSDYCYKSKFIRAMSGLVNSMKCKNVLISYYDENNHWNHGKEPVTYEGRRAIKEMLQQCEGIRVVDEEPFVVKRKNYQSQSGAHKKSIDELVFYGER